MIDPSNDRSSYGRKKPSPDGELRGLSVGCSKILRSLWGRVNRESDRIKK